MFVKPFNPETCEMELAITLMERYGTQDLTRVAREARELATAFLAVREAVRNGLSLAAPEEPVLMPVCAPNMPPTAPLNLVSQRYGDLDTVVRVNEWLTSNPEPATGLKAHLAAFNAAFPELKEWPLAWLRVARKVFPDLLSRAAARR